MILKKKKLSSALQLSAVETRQFKTETLSVCMILPIDENQSPASLLALSVLKRGTQKYPTQGDLNKKLDSLYATSLSLRSNRLAGRSLLGFTADMLDRQYTDSSVDVFGETLDVICQMLFHPLRDENGRFLDRYVESERGTQCDAIEAQINNPRTYAMKRCREIMFEGDVYGVDLLGTVEGVRAIDGDKLAQVYRSLVTNTRYEVFYVGSRTLEEVENQLNEHLLPLLAHAKTDAMERGCAWSREGDVRRVDEELPLSQSRLVLGFRTDTLLCDDDFYAVLVLNEIYGASPISKLFMNVRERLSLCYQCGSSYDPHKGVIFASGGIDGAAREKAEAEMLHQLSDIKEGKITKAELEAAKKSLLNNHRAVSDSPSGIEAFYMSRGEWDIHLSPEESMKKIVRISMKDVVRVAQKITLDTVYFLMGNGESDEEGADDEID